MNCLQWYELIDAFCKFSAVAEKYNFMPDEIERMAAELGKLSPMPKERENIGENRD